jgi:hypothetical protein
MNENQNEMNNNNKSKFFFFFISFVASFLITFSLLKYRKIAFHQNLPYSVKSVND